MSDSTLPLDQYPPHIIQAIAFYSEEKALWRLMATSKAFREVAEVELRPYLVEKKITSEPLLVHDIFKPISPGHLLDPQSRRTELARRSELLESHFAAYAPSASSLRHLTTEVRDDDDITGWTHVTRFANQLQRLGLHINDRTWRVAMEMSAASRTLWNVQNACRMPGDRDYFSSGNVWGRHAQVPFSNLTSLTLASTSNVAEHFWAINARLPMLEELILSCHWGIELEEDDRRYEGDNIDGLKRFTAIGTVWIVRDLLWDLLPTFPNLRFLTLSFSTSLSPENDHILSSVSLGIMCEGVAGLEGLAVYGANAALLMRSLSATQLALRNPISPSNAVCDLQQITTLALEQTTVDANGRRVYPFLSSVEDRPDLPALGTLILVLDQNGQTPAESEIYYDLPQLQALFAAYPTLQIVRWVSGYPTLGVDETVDTGTTTLCSVARVASDSDQSVLENVNLVRGL